MSTIIYPSPIFGPVHSRRLGVSLGINLLPGDGKVCTFNCVYCECGLNEDFRPKQKMPSREEVAAALEARLQDMQKNGPKPDVLTFAGNGEPTAHPHFPEIIDDTLRLRDLYFPNAKVSVLSNATLIHREKVHEALMRVDNNILKLDTVNPEYISLVDVPVGQYDVQEVIRQMKAFNGRLIIQTMFMKGSIKRGERREERGERLGNAQSEEREDLERSVDNTGEEFVGPWLEAVREIAPRQVMIYTIDRETPVEGLQKATHEELDSIRDRVLALGIPCTASY